MRCWAFVLRPPAGRGFPRRRFALSANAHISESRCEAPDFVAQFRFGPLAQSTRWSFYMNFLRLNAAMSEDDGANHSPFPRFSAKRLCQYASIPRMSSVRTRWIISPPSGDRLLTTEARLRAAFEYRFCICGRTILGIHNHIEACRPAVRETLLVLLEPMLSSESVQRLHSPVEFDKSPKVIWELWIGFLF